MFIICNNVQELEEVFKKYVFTTNFNIPEDDISIVEINDSTNKLSIWQNLSETYVDWKEDYPYGYMCKESFLESCEKFKKNKEPLPKCRGSFMPTQEWMVSRYSYGMESKEVLQA